MPDEPTRTLPPADRPTADPPPGDGPTPDLNGATAGLPGEPGEPPPPPAPPGYELLEEVGSGGMGTVYRARELALNRHVAVKFLQPRFSADGAAAARFVEEAQITGQLQHPGIPPVHAIGTLPDGRPFLVMKLIKGRTLEDLLRERPDPVADRGRLVAVFDQVCQAVACAHEYRVIHRDLKPANVMVGKFGEVQVMDWGLAKLLTAPDHKTEIVEEATAATVIRTVRDSDGSFTQAGSVLGTPAFMPPEQAGGEIARIDERSDVFGLGAILAVILTGKPPFVARDSEAVRLMAIRGQLADCLTRLDGCGAEPELVALAKRCLAADPADRPANAGEVSKAVAGLRAAAEDRAKRAELDRAAAEARTAEQRKRRKVQAALGLAFTALVVLAGAFAWWQDKQATDRKADQVRVDGERAADRAAADARARQAVESAVALAADLRDRYRFGEAALALDQAAALVPGTAPAETRARLAAARADLAFARRLDEIRINRVRSDFMAGLAALPAAYAAAFREYGIDPTGPDQAAAAARVAASPIKRHLVIALDDWSHMDSNFTTRGRLLAVVRRADPGPWSDRLRDLRTRASPAALDGLAAEVDPDTVPAHLVVLFFQLRQKAWPGAEKWLTAAALRHPDDFWVQFEAGYYYYAKLPRPALAVAFFQAARTLRPDLPLVLDLLGQAQTRASLHANAAASFREAVRLDPKYAHAHEHLGAALRVMKDLDGSIAESREAVRLDPKNAAAHINLGNALRDKGDLAGATASFREAARLDPRNPIAQNNLGNALRDAGRFDEAEAAYREAVRLDGDHHGAAIDALAELLRVRGDLEGAVVVYREIVRLDPKSARARLNLAVTLHDKRDVDGMIAELREAIRLDPKYALAYSNLGVGLKEKGDLAGAIKALREAVRLDPKYAGAYSNLGNALNEKGDLTGAVDAYRAAALLNPKNVGALVNLSLLLAKSGNFAGGLAACRAVVELDPNNGSGHNNLAYLLAVGPDGSRDGKLAIEHAIRACDLTDWKNPSFIDSLAAAYAEVGDFDKAVDYQKKALAFPVFVSQHGAEAHKRLELYRRKQPYRDPTFTPRAVAPPPREVNR